ncbi:hypothetical protein [Pseudomonas fulva]|uniref:Uncharacterized protein n=1 Tax=Pseudomonas fulva (strain 12-X) TaxID=743720 RepID=F6AG34_PSEF1|nr:hypothetical protein [Pseudomonas fulva]AEF21436.1 hypothetical protein Psefu_1460 [Pseudomonas fulva 12-X]
MANQITLAGIALDDHHEWTDEYKWSAVEQEQERSLSGALIVQEGVKKYGRPITLAANNAAWTPLAVVRQLEELRDQLGLVMPLELADGRTFHVIFNRVDGDPLEAQQLVREVEPGPDADYLITLRLITVPPPPEPPASP